jgi:formylglycine-generating enzyme required for sulfatase activity
VTGGTFYRTYSIGADGGPTGVADQATVSSFRLDKYLVTVARFRRFVTEWRGLSGSPPSPGSGKHAHLNGRSGLSDVSGEGGVAYEPGWLASDDVNVQPTDDILTGGPGGTWTPSAGSDENLPMDNVNWYEAYAFCIWDGGFLPSEAEYEYAAAGGSQQRNYPWGSADPGAAGLYAIFNCAYPTPSVPTGPPGCSSNYLPIPENFAPVGTATLGMGRWGQLDLVGNVSEWVLDHLAGYQTPCTDGAFLAATPLRVIRGGSFVDTTLSSLYPTARDGKDPGQRAPATGFRCARSP